jgi:hypothetical protein
LSKHGVRFRYTAAAWVAHAHPVTLCQYARRMRAAGESARYLVGLHPDAQVAALVAPLLMSRVGYRIGARGR